MLRKSLHRYLGLALSAILLVISVTGVMLLWKKEYLWLSVDGSREIIAPYQLPNAIETIENHYAENEVLFIQLYSEDLSIHKVFLSDRRYAWHTQHGEFIQQWKANERFEDLILDLHHRFLLGNAVGLNIAGFGGLFALLLIILGISIWWRRRQVLSKGFMLRRILTRELFANGSIGLRARLIVSHGNLGAVFAIPFALLIVTGVILVYPVESRWLVLESTGHMREANLDKTSLSELSESQAISKIDHSRGELISWRDMISAAYERFPNSQIRSVQPARLSEADMTAKRVVSLQQEHGWHRLGRTSMKFFADGRVEIRDELKQAMALRVFGFSYPLHTAKLGSLYKLFLTMVGLALALVCLFGVTSYLKNMLIPKRV